MEDGTARLQQMQEQLLSLIREQLQWLLAKLLADAFDKDSLLRFISSMGVDLSQLSNLDSQRGGLDPYQLMGLEKTAPDREVKKRYREFLMKLHPDTAGIKGTDRLFNMIQDAYRKIAKERGWG